MAFSNFFTHFLAKSLYWLIWLGASSGQVIKFQGPVFPAGTCFFPFVGLAVCSENPLLCSLSRVFLIRVRAMSFSSLYCWALSWHFKRSFKCTQWYCQNYTVFTQLKDHYDLQWCLIYGSRLALMLAVHRLATSMISVHRMIFKIIQNLINNATMYILQMWMNG